MSHGLSPRRWIRLGVAVPLTMALGLTGCSGFFTPVNNNGGTTTGSTTYAYVTNVNSSGTGGTITEYTDTSGVLTAVSGSPITLPALPTSIVVAPNNDFLFVATSLGVFVYTIGTGGALTEGNNGNVAYFNQNGLIPQSVAVDATSSWLIITYQKSTEVDALPIDSTQGVPTGSVYPATSTFAATNPTVVMSPANANVFVSLGTGGVNAFGFSPTATTSTPWGSRVAIPLTSGAINVADNAVAVDPTSTYLYIAEASTATTAVAGSLRTFPIANLVTSAEKDVPVGIGPSAILAEPTGSYVYVTNESDGTISGFSASAGVLTALSGSPFSTGKLPVGIAEDSTESYVSVIGYGTNPNLWLYKYDATTAGTLDVQTTATTASSNPSLSNGIALSH
ncbi:lactonase family protein [Acidicapsa dinghuensis]|uniref:Lactonase family protein n=1 Tax=Acidicapsa dinghuensis TaxID=2218256 RepID=A0ABW1EME9_9BACT|nr:lactonase family protein [Acidicapsa dinghuensis]